MKGRPFARYLIGHHRRKSAERIRVNPETGCHEWQGACTPLGYGRARIDGRETYVHRSAYERRYGAIPARYDIDHLCRNPSCCNPDHLEAVTHAENMRRGDNTILTESEARTIKASSERLAVLAERYGVSKNNVARIRNGKQWRDI